MSARADPRLTAQISERLIGRTAVWVFLAFALAMPININPLSQTDSAEAASCRNRGGASERFSYSSQVNGTVFTLCGKAIFKLLPKPRQSAKAATTAATTNVPAVTARSPRSPWVGRPRSGSRLDGRRP